jgi:curved DNA-binding protein CbpA
VLQDFKDYYNILNVPFLATDAEIKTAYRKLARELHPDLHPDETEYYTSQFQEVTEAYETLSDVEKKTIYDFRYRQFVLHEGPQYEYVEDTTPPDTTNYKHKYTYRNRRTVSYASVGALVLLSLHFLRLLIDAAPVYDSPHYNRAYQPIQTGTMQTRSFPKNDLKDKTDSLALPFSNAPFMDNEKN